MARTMKIEMEIEPPMACELCGELFEQGNANKAIAVIKDRVIEKVYCAGCFIRKIAKELPAKVSEIVSDWKLI